MSSATILNGVLKVDSRKEVRKVYGNLHTQRPTVTSKTDEP